MDLILRGSQTAKDGFKDEDDIVKKFNDWKKDKDEVICNTFSGKSGILLRSNFGVCGQESSQQSLIAYSLNRAPILKTNNKINNMLETNRKPTEKYLKMLKDVATYPPIKKNFEKR